MIISHKKQNEHVNTAHVIKIKLLNAMDSAMLSLGTTLSNYQDGHAYILFKHRDGTDTYWDFENEDEAIQVFKRIGILDTKEQLF